MTDKPDPADKFHVSGWMDWGGAFVTRWPGVMRWLSQVESDTLGDRLDEVRIDRPVYVCGLARSGTTVLLECLAEHPQVGTHQYRDFPPLYLPYGWNWLLQRMGSSAEPQERAHGDGILVTPASPEAFEEPIWMAFFPGAHDPQHPAVLDSQDRNPDFDRFYQDHIRKLLLARERSRYVAKGNYNLVRLGYLKGLFADARFILAVRHPVGHVASLRKQDRLFTRAIAKTPKAAKHLERVGHFEFGPVRRLINTGDTARLESIEALWRDGQEARGWARYWAMIYTAVLDRLEEDADLRAACHLVHYERLCATPGDSLAAVFDHAGLTLPEALHARLAGRIAAPRYYSPDFDDAETAAILEETAAIRARLGYDDSGLA